MNKTVLKRTAKRRTMKRNARKRGGCGCNIVTPAPANATVFAGGVKSRKNRKTNKRTLKNN